MSNIAKGEEEGCGAAHNFNCPHVSHDYTEDMRLDNTLVLRLQCLQRRQLRLLFLMMLVLLKWRRRQ